MNRTVTLILVPALFTCVFCRAAAAQEKTTAVADKGILRLQAPPTGRFQFGGVLGDRIDANLRHWLLPAPRANPGLTEMFRVRDRQPLPQLVDWAGEFAGKYLISAVQARRMVDSPKLDQTIRQVVDELLAAQADDGYLGPFRKEERLLGHWDLWGHYHVMLALVMVAEELGDRRSLDAAGRAADLICTTYLDGKRRVFDAGSHEMNMAVVHVLGRLYRITGRDRYLQMVRHIEEDWQRAGDYFRKGLAGLDFHRTPRPRWESLHDVQGLVELHRITGRSDYGAAFTNLWTSIRRYDRHNSGSFSTGEGAIGSPYRPGAIETCCTVAWMALSLDMLALTGDPCAADELELSTYNGMLASQHPSGRWWTYDTPMDGTRQASAHAIVFQARAGTPELNCCSVNGPRGLGMLSEWAVMTDAEGPVVNHYGPSTVSLPWGGKPRLTLVQDTRYPAEEDIQLRIESAEPAEFNLRLRIPAWSRQTAIAVNGRPVEDVRPGTYHGIRRRWEPGDTVEIRFDFSPRYWAGEQEAAGKASIYRGPLLLAFDSHHNRLDCAAVPVLDVRRLTFTPVAAEDTLSPIVLLEVASSGGEVLRLCDFATAGAHGNEYRSWLPAVNALPQEFELKSPAPDGRIPPGPIRFAWVGFPSGSPHGARFDLLVSRDARFDDPVLKVEGLARTGYRHREGLPAGRYFWKVVARNQAGAMENRPGPWTFVVDATLPPAEDRLPAAHGPERILISSELDGAGDARHGQLSAASGVEPAPDRQGLPGRAVRFNGRDSRLQYAVEAFPDEDYTVCAWIYVEAFASKQYQQVFSAWARPMDDPLRLCVTGDTLQARIEMGQTYATPAVRIGAGRWIHVAAVKSGAELRLYVDGAPQPAVSVPEVIESSSTGVALGANPLFAGDEYFNGRIDSFSLHAMALSAEQIRQRAGS